MDDAILREVYNTAVERAENEFFTIKANVNAGRRIFSPMVQQAEDEYLEYRWNVDVKRGSITEGGWGTIKSHLNHFVAYCGIVGREAQSSVTRLNDLESKSLQGYQQYRQQKGAKDVTIKNEQSTISALCKWAFDAGSTKVTIKNSVHPFDTPQTLSPARCGIFKNGHYSPIGVIYGRTNT